MKPVLRDSNESFLSYEEFANCSIVRVTVMYDTMNDDISLQ